MDGGLYTQSSGAGTSKVRGWVKLPSRREISEHPADISIFQCLLTRIHFFQVFQIKWRNPRKYLSLEVDVFWCLNPIPLIKTSWRRPCTGGMRRPGHHECLWPTNPPPTVPGRQTGVSAGGPPAAIADCSLMSRGSCPIFRQCHWFFYSGNVTDARCSRKWLSYLTGYLPPQDRPQISCNQCRLVWINAFTASLHVSWYVVDNMHVINADVFMGS